MKRIIFINILKSIKKYFRCIIYNDCYKILNMNKFITIDEMKNILNRKDLLKANFGLEKEGLRVDCDAKLVLTPHPEVFGNKDENIYITTDFSESQLELITPPYTSIDETYDFLSLLVNIINSYINECEFIWNSSLPCILPESDKIPIARYKFDKESEIYRQKLAKKYGTKKQMISGIHFNFSFNIDVLKRFYENLDYSMTYKEFQNQIYLKIVRNYIRLTWFIIYITGCSVALHESFTCECIKLTDLEGLDGCFYATKAISLRNSQCGYKNKEELYPNYESVDSFLESIENFIEAGYISEAKELYTQIRLKTMDKTDVIKTLKEDGIDYLEVRSIDINPFDKTGVDKNDLEFIHLFMIYLLQLDESDYPDWQKESLANEELVATKGLDNNLELLNDGKKITIQEWSKQVIKEIKEVNKELDLGFEEVIEIVEDRVNNTDKLYANRLLCHYKDENFLDTSIKLAKQKKKDSIKQMDENINKETLNKIINNKQLD